MKHDEKKIEDIKKSVILKKQAELWEIQAKELHQFGEIKTREFDIFDTCIKQYAEHMVQQEKERIQQSGENILDIEMQHYGTDKHGLSREQFINLINK